MRDIHGVARDKFMNEKRNVEQMRRGVIQADNELWMMFQDGFSAPCQGKHFRPFHIEFDAMYPAEMMFLRKVVNCCHLAKHRVFIIRACGNAG